MSHIIILPKTKNKNRNYIFKDSFDGVSYSFHDSPVIYSLVTHFHEDELAHVKSLGTLLERSQVPTNIISTNPKLKPDLNSLSIIRQHVRWEQKHNQHMWNKSATPKKAMTIHITRTQKSANLYISLSNMLYEHYKLLQVYDFFRREVEKKCGNQEI